MQKKNIRDEGFYYVKYDIIDQYDILFWNAEENRWEISDEIYDELTSCMKVMGKVPSFEEWQKFRYMVN